MNVRLVRLMRAPALCVALLIYAPVWAINVDVIPSQPSLNVGEMLTVDVVISDLGLFSPPSLSVFDIDLNFDNSLFAPGAVTFGDQLDLFGFGINLRAALICAQEFARARVAAGGGGVILNVSSIAGHRGFEQRKRTPSLLVDPGIELVQC